MTGRRLWVDHKKHPCHAVADRKGQFEDAEVAVQFVYDWFTNEMDSPFLRHTCLQVATRKPTNCKCLHTLSNTFDIETPYSNRTLMEISAFVIYFARLSYTDKTRQIMQWKRYADVIGKSTQGTKIYCLPLTSLGQDETELPNPDAATMVCKNAMLSILGKGQKFWQKCCKAVESNLVPNHGLKGQPLNNAIDLNSPLFLSLDMFFSSMEEFAETRAPRMVRESTNDGVRDNNLLDLPAHMTKRQLYRRWCRGQGWVLSTSDMGNWMKHAAPEYEGMLKGSIVSILLWIYLTLFSVPNKQQKVFQTKSILSVAIRFKHFGIKTIAI